MTEFATVWLSAITVIAVYPSIDYDTIDNHLPIGPSEEQTKEKTNAASALEKQPHLVIPGGICARLAG